MPVQSTVPAAPPGMLAEEGISPSHRRSSAKSDTGFEVTNSTLSFHSAIFPGGAGGACGLGGIGVTEICWGSPKTAVSTAGEPFRLSAVPVPSVPSDERLLAHVRLRLASSDAAGPE